MHDLNTTVANLSERFVKIKDSFDLEEKKKQLLSLESDSMDPNLWDDNKNARDLMQELSDLKDERIFEKSGSKFEESRLSFRDNLSLLKNEDIFSIDILELDTCVICSL